MKPYTPEKLVAISRYQNYFPTLPEEVRGEVYRRMDALIKEEAEYCDRGNVKHMAQILTSIALYEVLRRHGQTEAEAYGIVSGEMWKFLDPSGMQKLARRSFFLPLMKKLVPLGFKKGSGFGWRYTWHRDDPRDEFHFECNECIYAKILGKRNLMKLGGCAATRASSITGTCRLRILSGRRRSARAASGAISALCGTIPTPATGGSEPGAYNALLIQKNVSQGLLFRHCGG